VHKIVSACFGVAAVLGSVVGVPTHTAGATSTDQPNILLVMTDDQSYSTLAQMANVQKLARRGTTFTDYHANFPLCCPSRTTTLTGQYVHNHEVWGNSGATSGGYDAFAPGAGNSLPVWLQGAGYKTMMVGKFLNGYRDDDGVPPGWDRWRVSNIGNTYNYDGAKLVEEDGKLHTYDGYKTDIYRDMALRLIDESSAEPSAEPWFMWLAFNAPHIGTPIDADDSELVTSSSPPRRDRNAYRGTKAPTYGTAIFNENDVSDKPRHVRLLPKMKPALISAVNESYSQQLETLQSVDDALGTIEDKLAETGQLDNTVIIFTTDNGYYYGEHRIKAGKQSPYTAASRLPLIVAGPGFARGAVRTEPRLNTDLAATLVSLAGAKAGRTQDGVTLTKQTSVWRPLLLEGRIPKGSAGVIYHIRQYSAVLTPRWFYARYRYTDGALGVELYDLRHDPNMLHNLRTRPKDDERKAELRATMEAMAGYRV
jgi:N-acetylglucosamine-6-sulfatase